MITKKELEQLLAKLERHLPDEKAQSSKSTKRRSGRPKKYDDRLVLLLVALREKYGWSLRELEKKAKEVLPKNTEIPDFSSIHYRIRKLKEHLDNVMPKIIEIVPAIEGEEAVSTPASTKKAAAPKAKAKDKEKDKGKTKSKTKGKSTKKTSR